MQATSRNFPENASRAIADPVLQRALARMKEGFIERRANAVKNYLEALGVNGNRVTTVSYGKERPEVQGSSEEAWAQNRRGVTMATGGAPSS